MKIKCVIIDDEPLAREGISDYVSKTAFLQLVGEFKNSAEAKDYLEEHLVDLIFLDINMPGDNGLQLLKTLNEKPSVIFTTAYREYAAESYELDAIDYLVKPIAFERFLKAVNKVYTQTSTDAKPDQNDLHFFVKVDGAIVKVLLDEVLFVEGMKDYVRIHRREKPVLMTLISLKQMEEKLPQEFIRVHRSFIANTKAIDKIEGNTLKIGDQEVPIAPQIRNTVLEKIMGGKFLKR